MRLWHYLAGLLLLLFPSPLLAQTPIPLPGTRPEAIETSFGVATAASDAYFATTDPVANAVYVFRTDAGASTFEARLEVEPNVLVGTRAGGLAFAGTRLVVGAPGADEGRGAAFVFELGPNGWTQTARLMPSERIPASQFGVSVAASGDRIVVGQTALYVNRGEHDAAVVFAREASGAWAQEARLVSGIPPNADDSQIDGVCFGWTVAIRGDQIAVGAPSAGNSLHPRGRVYRFRRDASAWTAEAPIETPAGGALLGGAAFADSDLIVSSSRGWHVYRDGALAAVLADTLASEGTGYARAFSASDRVIVAIGRGSRGMSLVRFERDGEGWALRPDGTITPRSFVSASSNVAGTSSHSYFGDFVEGHVIAYAADGSRSDTLRAPGVSRPFARGTQAGTAVALRAGRLVVGLPGADPAAPAAYQNRRGAAVLREPSGASRLISGAVAQSGNYVGAGEGFVVFGGRYHYEAHGDVSRLFVTTLPSAQTLGSVT